MKPVFRIKSGFGSLKGRIKNKYQQRGVVGVISGFLTTKKEEAVSPIIATILLVAITVVLAATLYITVGHFGTGGSAPMAGSIAEVSATTTTVTLQLTYTVPGNMTDLNNIHMELITTAGTPEQFTGTFPTYTTSSVSGLTLTVNNPVPAVTTALMSGATLVFSGSAAQISALSGETFELSYTGNSGDVSVVLS